MITHQQPRWPAPALLHLSRRADGSAHQDGVDEPLHGTVTGCPGSTARTRLPARQLRGFLRRAPNAEGPQRVRVDGPTPAAVRKRAVDGDRRHTRDAVLSCLLLNRLVFHIQDLDAATGAGQAEDELGCIVAECAARREDFNLAKRHVTPSFPSALAEHHHYQEYAPWSALQSQVFSRGGLAVRPCFHVSEGTRAGDQPPPSDDSSVRSMERRMISMTLASREIESSLDICLLGLQ